MYELFDLKFGRNAVTCWIERRWRKPFFLFRRYRYGRYEGRFILLCGPLFFMGYGFQHTTTPEKG